MIDRFEAFKQATAKQGFVSVPTNAELENTDEEDDQVLLGKYIPVTKAALERLKIMEANNQRINELRKKQAKEVKGEKEAEMRKEFSEVLEESRKSQSEVKSVIESMGQTIKECQSIEEYKGEPELRVMQGIHGAVLRKFKLLLRDFQESQINYKNSVQGKIERWVTIVKPDATDNEIQEYMKDPESISKLLQKEIGGTASMQLKGTVSDIEEKYKHIQQLEKSVEEVYQLFIDLQTLIAAQGEMLDSIEQNLDDAIDYMKNSQKHLQGAKKQHKKSQTKMCIILIILVVVIAFLLVFVLGVVSLNSIV